MINIYKQSVCGDASTFLDSFLKQLEACDYVIYGDLITFQYSGCSNSFDMHAFKEIYSEFKEEVSGLLHPTSWQVCIEDINHKLSLTSHGQGESYDKASGFEFVSHNEKEQRIKTFWHIIEKSFSLPPEVIYKYENYLNDYVSWYCYYIFLNKGNGLILRMGMSD